MLDEKLMLVERNESRLIKLENYLKSRISISANKQFVLSLLTKIVKVIKKNFRQKNHFFIERMLFLFLFVHFTNYHYNSTNDPIIIIVIIIKSSIFPRKFL